MCQCATFEKVVKMDYETLLRLSQLDFCEHNPADVNEPYWVKGKNPALYAFSLWLLKTTLIETKGVNNRHSSYGMKHVIEHLCSTVNYKSDYILDDYMTNGQFKFVMLKAGFYPSNPYELNWHYKIAEGSPFFKFERGSFAEVFEKFVMIYQPDMKR